jgi:ferredoxin
VRKPLFGLDLGPIADTFRKLMPVRETASASSATSASELQREHISFRQDSAEEWRAKHMHPDGTVSLWLEDDFNDASRLPGASANTLDENRAWDGRDSSELPSPCHTVTIHSIDGWQTHTIEVPEDRYILFQAEKEGSFLPYACRHGCCTSCAVKIQRGNIHYPEGLGMSATMRDEGYALLCVGMPDGDVECQLQDEDEVYMKQFGEAFEELATDANAPSVERDDIAVEWLNLDE